MDGSVPLASAAHLGLSSPPGSNSLLNVGFPPPLAWSLLCSDTVLLFACAFVAVQNPWYLLQNG